MSMIPKGGDTIWGDLDSSPEEDYLPSKRRQNATHEAKDGSSEPKRKRKHYGRIISFGKDIAEADSSEINRVNFRVRFMIYFNDNC